MDKTTNINQVSEEYWRERSYLHVLWMITNAVNELIWFNFINANTMNSSEEWKFVFHVLCFEHNINLSGGDWTLN